MGNFRSKLDRFEFEYLTQIYSAIKRAIKKLISPLKRVLNNPLTRYSAHEGSDLLSQNIFSVLWKIISEQDIDQLIVSGIDYYKSASGSFNKIADVIFQ